MCFLQTNTFQKHTAVALTLIYRGEQCDVRDKVSDREQNIDRELERGGKKRKESKSETELCWLSRPTVTVTKGVWLFALYSCELSHTHTHTHARTEAKCVRYSELIPLIWAHNNTSTSHKPPLNAGLRPALIHQHTYSTCLCRFLSATSFHPAGLLSLFLIQEQLPKQAVLF